MFGRGGEEAEALAAAGVPFEIVPGVTAALGACAAAGIPLTHRAAGQSVTLVSGHHDPDSEGCSLDWDALAQSSNLVFYMATRHLAKIADRLMAAGLAPETPAAVVEKATRPDMRVIDGPLHRIAALAAGVRAPAVLAVGAPVLFRQFTFREASRTEGVLAQ